MIRQLVVIKHGSHLYGTNTPSSDLDLKGVHLPDGKDIILQSPQNVIDRKIKFSTTIKNSSEDIDNQSYSLQKFLKMIEDGDTNATEILFAPDECILEQDEHWPYIRAVCKSLINSQCKGYVGYVRRQASKYGVKGSRMAAVKKLLDIFESVLACSAQFGPRDKLSRIDNVLKTFSEHEEHAEWINIPNVNGTDLWHIKCCDRSMPMTASIGEAHKVYNAVWENYGDRARQAMNNQGIDWKAVSHAVRVSRQAVELLTTGAITFPRPDAEELRRIKLGQENYNDVSKIMDKLLDDVEQASLVSLLPSCSNQDKIEELILDNYTSQIEAYWKV